LPRTGRARARAPRAGTPGGESAPDTRHAPRHTRTGAGAGAGAGTGGTHRVVLAAGEQRPQRAHRAVAAALRMRLQRAGERVVSSRDQRAERRLCLARVLRREALALVRVARAPDGAPVLEPLVHPAGCGAALARQEEARERRRLPAHPVAPRLVQCACGSVLVREEGGRELGDRGAHVCEPRLGAIVPRVVRAASLAEPAVVSCARLHDRSLPWGRSGEGHALPLASTRFSITHIRSSVRIAGAAEGAGQSLSRSCTGSRGVRATW